MNKVRRNRFALCLLVSFGIVACAMPQFWPAPAETPVPAVTETPPPTATSVPILTPTPVFTPTPAHTATPDVSTMYSYPRYGVVVDLLSERYGYAEPLDLLLEPDSSIFVLFATADGGVSVAEIAVVGGRWEVLRVYSLPRDEPTARPGRRLPEQSG